MNGRTFNVDLGSAESALFTDVLEPGEKLLWSDRPRQGLILRGSDALLIPFSLLWCGFVVFWERSVIATRAPWFFVLWGIPFVAAGIYFVIGRFVVDAYQRAHTVYGVTDRRALILAGIFRRRIRTLALEGMTEIDLSHRADGRGTLTFGRDTYGFYSNFMFRGWPGTPGLTPAFEGIPDAPAVLRLIRQAQRNLIRS